MEIRPSKNTKDACLWEDLRECERICKFSSYKNY